MKDGDGFGRDMVIADEDTRHGIADADVGGCTSGKVRLVEAGDEDERVSKANLQPKEGISEVMPVY